MNWLTARSLVVFKPLGGTLFDGLALLLAPWLERTTEENVERHELGERGQPAPILVPAVLAIDVWRAMSAAPRLMPHELPWQADHTGAARLVGITPAASPTALIVGAVGFELVNTGSNGLAPEGRTMLPGAHTDSLGDDELCHQVKAALRVLYRADELGRSPLLRLRCLNPEDEPVRALRALLMTAIAELEVAPVAGKRQCGALLRDAYIRRVGSHELIAERLGLARTTYYRRLSHAYAHLAAWLRIAELSATAFAPVNDTAADGRS